MAHLLSLSPELLHCIFIKLELADLASLAQTCHATREFVVNNVLLHKELYLEYYEHCTASKSEPNWVDRAHGVVRLTKILKSKDCEVKRRELGFVADQVCYLLETAGKKSDMSVNVAMLEKYFDKEGKDNCDVFLCASSIWRTGGTEAQQAAATAALRQASAKLHCLYGNAIETVDTHSTFITGLSRLSGGNTGITLDWAPQSGAGSKDISAHSVARSRVYDLRTYTEDTLWGPFMDDGSQRIDWERVEAIMMVLAFNLRKLYNETGSRMSKIWEERFAGATPGSDLASSHQLAVHLSDHKYPYNKKSLAGRSDPALDKQDPYGVTGTWLRVVTFLDYNDLYAFNFSNEIPADEARQPIEIEEGIIDLVEKVCWGEIEY